MTPARPPARAPAPAVDAGRRQALAALAALWGLGAGALPRPALAQAHTSLGNVLPRRTPPGLVLALHDGRSLPLAALLQGRVTALQLVFTGCSAVCPLQGAVFAQLQRRVLGTQPVPGAQLLSLSIDPLNDDAAALARWRQRFAAADGWLAAAPPPRHADAMLDFVAGRAAAAADRHTAQVYLFDAQGRLAYTCAELAPADDIARAMAALARQG